MARDVSEQRSKAKDIFWHLNWLRDLIQHEPDNELCDFLNFCRLHLAESNAQAFQDLFVLYTLDRKASGYFVEFGAADGIHMSNSFMLEKHYGWNGILAEPARIWRAGLQENRNCRLDYRCVFQRTGETVSFNEVGTGEISTIANFGDLDSLAAHRKSGTLYDVETVSLCDLLHEHAAPREIDYLSIDTEGSEFVILQDFDFDRYDIRVITVEHNFVESIRSDIFGLLTSKGFKRKFETFSAFDDWYVRAL